MWGGREQPFSKQSHVANTSLSAATHWRPLALPAAPRGLTEEQRLEAEGSDEVVPVGHQLDLLLVSHLREGHRGQLGRQAAPPEGRAPGPGKRGQAGAARGRASP